MNQTDLDRLLKSVQPPARSAEYWDTFPNQVTARLDAPATVADVPRSSPGSLFFFRFAWAAGLAAFCVILGYAIGFRRGHESTVTDAQLAQAGKYYREIEALFPNQIRAIVFERQGPRLILADHADVPASTPLCVKICGPDGCREFITFSGQQIPVNGENCEVLADARNRVLLLGKNRVWSESDSSGSIRVAARPLGAAL
jgi:hypothetical protein